MVWTQRDIDRLKKSGAIVDGHIDTFIGPNGVIQQVRLQPKMPVEFFRMSVTNGRGAARGRGRLAGWYGRVVSFFRTILGRAGKGGSPRDGKPASLSVCD